MKLIYRYFIISLLVLLAFCNNRRTTGDPLPEVRQASDTVFVLVDVNNTNKDSLESMYGKFVTPETQTLINDVVIFSGSVRVRIPLLPGKWVNDFENIFSRVEEAYLDSLLKNYEDEHSTEIRIISIDSSWTTRAEFDDYIIRLHNAWNIGERYKNNGILIGISQGYKIIRISNGYGIEGRLTDHETKVIIDEVMIPRYKTNDFFEGTKAGLLAVMKELQ